MRKPLTIHVDFGLLAICLVLSILLVKEKMKELSTPIVITSSYNPEDELVWRTLSDEYYACFPKVFIR